MTANLQRSQHQASWCSSREGLITDSRQLAPPGGTVSGAECWLHTSVTQLSGPRYHSDPLLLKKLCNSRLSTYELSNREVWDANRCFFFQQCAANVDKSVTKSNLKYEKY